MDGSVESHARQSVSAVLVTAPMGTQNLPFLPQRRPKPLPVLTAPTHRRHIPSWPGCWLYTNTVHLRTVTHLIIIRLHRRQRSVASTVSRCVHDGEPWSTRHECQKVCRRRFDEATSCVGDQFAGANNLSTVLSSRLDGEQFP